MTLSLDPRKLCQIEIQVCDEQTSLQFYGEVFGWKEAPIEIHGLRLLLVPENCPWGISLIPTPSAAGQHSQQIAGRPRQILYFNVTRDQLDLILDRTEEYGGRIVRRQVQTPGYGEITQIDDPDGYRWGLVLT